MSTAQEEPECPLCMEAFDVDDLSFYPCTCGYQICRFCWHRIRNDENGLCPACRKPYPEDPAQFRPLTEDEVHNIKRDRRQKESQRKQKSAENRKHLANVRVVQKNLVFVVGLSQRLADSDVLKRHEYFGKFGKIHKVVINQSTSYVGSQGPSASAYVTYLRPEDALHAILVVNNLQIDNRTLKASLGTTKYCSHFLKGTQCTKSDCMYLHDLGDEAASFSKEDIQQGKHLQYEQKLVDQYSQNSLESNRLPNGKSKSPSPSSSDHGAPGTAATSMPEGSNPSQQPPSSPPNPKPLTDAAETAQNFGTSNGQLDKIDRIECESKAITETVKGADLSNNNSSGEESQSTEGTNADKGAKQDDLMLEDLEDSDVLDDDFGFDPWELSSKGLADMIEKERQLLQKLSLTGHLSQMGSQVKGTLQNQPQNNHNHHNSIPYGIFQPQHNWPPKPFSPPFIDSARQNSKLLQMMVPNRSSSLSEEPHFSNSRVADSFNGHVWQENLKALLPNINISFSAPNSSSQQLRRTTHPLLTTSPVHHNHNGYHLFNNPLQFQDQEWYSNGGQSGFNSLQSIASDPAIISTGVVSDGNNLWMEPFNEVGDTMCHVQHHQLHRHHQNYGVHSPPEAPPSWMQQHTRYPPPGFSTRQQDAPTEHRLPAL